MQPLAVLVGPTAVGKTRIGVDIAKRINGEIISGDSMQVYRFMDIGTAKIRHNEMNGVTHHLLNIINPDEPFSVADFQRLATEKIEEIANRQKIPLIVGGTGLYIQAVIDRYDFAKQQPAGDIRLMLQKTASEKGNDHLHRLLAETDPKAAEKIHPNDTKRIIRALEYFYVTGKCISENTVAYDRSKHRKYNAVMIGLNMERNLLYQRINARVDKMMAEGWLEETKTLLKMGYSPDLPSMQGLGYRQLIGYLQGKYDLATAVELIKKETRRYAKRQLTWYRRDPRISWFNVENYANIYELVAEILTIIGRTIKINVEY